MRKGYRLFPSFFSIDILYVQPCSEDTKPEDAEISENRAYIGKIP